jgi:hypothetical protein
MIMADYAKLLPRAIDPKLTEPSSILDCAVEVERLSIDMPVVVRFDDVSSGWTLLKFVPVGESERRSSQALPPPDEPRRGG